MIAKYNLNAFSSLLALLFVSFSTVSGQSDIAPAKPLITYVTYIGDSGEIEIRWSPSTSKDIRTYHIDTVDITTTPSITGYFLDSVPADTLVYRYHEKDTKTKIYTILAIDKSNNKSLESGDFHKPVKLDIAYDSCSSAMVLNWEKYYGWKNNLTGYRVYAKENNGNFSLVTDLIDTTTLKFTYKNIKENTDYEFYIEAYDNRGRTSTSNVRKKYTFMPAPPSFLDLNYVSVIDSRTVEISFSADITGTMNDFLVSRSSSLFANFTPLTSVRDLTEATTTITDNIATQGELFYYKVEALNSCSAPVLSSNTGNNLKLTGISQEGNITLSWTPYQKFRSGILEYRIYRKNSAGDFELHGYSPPDATEYKEEIASSAGSGIEGRVAYYIEAVEAGVNSTGIQGLCKSNEINVTIDSRLYIPNAFTPDGDGLNDVFIPVIDFLPKEFRMYIYDRSGKALFLSTDPTVGWDGTMNGSVKAPESTYIYHIEYASFSGGLRDTTGHVTLIYP